MEDTLRGGNRENEWLDYYVIILVLMEDTLRAYNYGKEECYRECHNPCFNGRYSQSRKTIFIMGLIKS